MVKARLLKSGLPKIAAMTGVRRSLTRALTTAVNAAPMTTATARSTTLPRRMKSRNSLRVAGRPRHGREAIERSGRRRERRAPAVPSTPAHGPLALLRRHRRLGADRPPRPARDAAAPRRRPAALRLRRGHPAPAAAHGRAARHAGRLPHPPPRRPLARAAGDAQVLRAARPPGAADRLRPARHRRAHARHADRLRAPALPVRRRRPRGRRRRRLRRLRGRRRSTSATAATPSATRSSRSRGPGASTPSWRRAWAWPSAPTSGACSAARSSTACAPSRSSAPSAPGARSSSRATPRRARCSASPPTRPTSSSTRRPSPTRSTSAPLQTGHSTARQAAELAREAEVRLLVLTHVSTRYAGGEIRDEARATFERTEVPRDFDLVEVPVPREGRARAAALRRRAGERMTERRRRGAHARRGPLRAALRAAGHGPGRRRRLPGRRAAHRHPRRRPAGLQGAHADRRPRRPRAARVPALVGQRLDVALDRLEAPA